MIYHLYDWDETLVSSKHALFLAYKEVLDEMCIEFNFEYFSEFIYQDSISYLSEICKFSEDEIKTIRKQKNDLYLKKYISELVFYLPTINPNDKYFIVTNTSANLVCDMLKHYDNLNNTTYHSAFEIIGTDVVPDIRKKPAPDLYEYIFKYFIKRLKPEDSIHIYEDSQEGLLSASQFLYNYKKRIPNFKLNHIILK
jgi:beta-phosphoglucomutase-like phosphatase (HAD superfamily)